ncbi:MAG TPA: hypothetical protein VFR59_03220 [Steroidobacteraceae bacterium]|nr:hypothetical protein [Steroidobacteraceae bacterium]
MKILPWLITGLLCCSFAQAGSEIQSASRALPAGNQTAATTLQVEAGQLRMEQTDAEGKPAESGLIFKNDTIYGLNHAGRTYTVVDRATIARIADRMGQNYKKMQEQIEQMPPEQRDAMEVAMRGSKTEFAKSGRSEKVDGKNCQIWEGTREGEKVIEYCVVPYASVAGGQEVVNTMKNLMNLMQAMYDAMSGAAMGASPFTTEWEGVNSIDGFPVVVRVFEEGTPMSENRLKSSRSLAVPADRFEVPTGYTLQKMEGVQ